MELSRIHHLSRLASLLNAFISNYHFVASAAAWWWWYLCVFEVGQRCCSKITTLRRAGELWSPVKGWCWILEWALISLFPWVFWPCLSIYLVLLISFALTATKLMSSVMEAGLGLEKQPMRESIAQSGIGRDVSERPWRNQFFFSVVLAPISFSYNRH